MYDYLDLRQTKRLKELVPYKALAPDADAIIKELERLNNIIDTMLEFSFFKEECPLNFGFGDEKEEKAQDVFYEDDYCEENCKLREEHNITDIKLLDENNRLNNIISELEKWLIEHIDEYREMEQDAMFEFRLVLDKLKALKENNK